MHGANYFKCTKNFYSYAKHSNQAVVTQGQSWSADPDDVYLYVGDKFMLKTQYYAYPGFGKYLKTSILKTLGIKLTDD